MELNRKTRLALAVHHWVFIVLLLILAALLAALSRQYHTSWDLSLNARNSLSPGSQAFLAKLSGPVRITAYCAPDGDTARAIRDFLTPYQRVKRDMALTFVDPDREPQLARAAGIQREGELVVEYAGRSEHLTLLNEMSFTNLLMRLARDRERVVMYLDGHGERKLEGGANFDLGEFGGQLTRRGFRLSPLKLTLAQEVPANAALLVIAGPRVDLLPGEVDKLKAWLYRGGNLLWLMEPGPLHGLQPLAEQLGLVLNPGVVVDPAAQNLNAPPTWALSAAYAHHPVIGPMELVTVFPMARAVGVAEAHDDWQATSLVEVAPRGWVETGPPNGPLRFDKGQDTPGPVTVAVALERHREGHAQRVVVVGSADFLSNQFLGNGGNLDLGVNMINWLAGDDNLISIQPRPTRDAEFALSRSRASGIALVFLVVLPLAFLSMGGLLWWRRRKG
ncbi:GldG family protein [Thiobacter aerophilum]|uniref:GldG family protein n=1 Tax=Thiobacter aerophilum TaxID=3121275 RepID=A0ABV0EEG4_9BURK